MFDDPRTKARSFLESSGVVTELEDVLNALIYEKPDDLHGFLVSFLFFIQRTILDLGYNDHYLGQLFSRT